MASTNKTANLGLNQWEQTDPAAREDFNEDNRIIDENAMCRKLMDITLTEEKNDVQFDFSGIDLEKFAEFRFHSSVHRSDTYMRINRYSEKYYKCELYNGNGHFDDKITLSPHVTQLFIEDSKYVVGSLSSPFYHELERSHVPQINTVEITASGSRFKPGDRFIVWGLMM